MGNAGSHTTINYIEFTTPDVARAKQFYTKGFGWNFQDWGEEYISFEKSSAGIDGGFRKGIRGGATDSGGPADCALFG